VLTEIANTVGSSTDVLRNQPHIESEDVSQAVLFILSLPENVQVSSFILQH